VRLKRARELAGVDTRYDRSLPEGAVLADPEQLRHNNTYGVLPRYYADQLVTCRQCGKEEVWPAARQKWWYEVAKGNINTRAVLCRACRAVERQRRDDARRVHLEGLARKQAKGGD
jgi:hypothetical protein